MILKKCKHCEHPVDMGACTVDSCKCICEVFE